MADPNNLSALGALNWMIRHECAINVYQPELGDDPKVCIFVKVDRLTHQGIDRDPGVAFVTAISKAMEAERGPSNNTNTTSGDRGAAGGDVATTEGGERSGGIDKVVEA